MAASPKYSPADLIEGAKFLGVHARAFDHPMAANPYPDMPGHYVMHAAWRWGWLAEDAAQKSGDFSAMQAAGYY